MIELKTRIFNIKATGLTLKKEGTPTLDPYVKMTFDGSKKFKTETISKNSSPEWKFDQSICLHVNNLDDLTNKKFDVECFDSCLLGSDNLIGSCSVNLYTLLTGPIQHRMVLRNKGVPNGHIEFSVEISEIRETLLTFKNIRANFYQQTGAQETYLHYYTQNQKTNEKSNAYKSKKSVTTHWEDIDQVLIQTGLKELLENPIVFNIVSSKNYKPETDPQIGQSNLLLSSLIVNLDQLQDNCKITFIEPIMNQQMVVGVFEGEIYFNNVSLYAQMIGGTHTDVGIQGGVTYLVGSIQPQQSPQTVIAQPTPSTNNVQSQAFLPEGWEQRVHTNGQIYYVHHPTKSTHWELPEQIRISQKPIPVPNTVIPSVPSPKSSPPSSVPSFSQPIQQQQPIMPPQQPISRPVQQQPQQQPIQPVQPVMPPMYNGQVTQPQQQQPIQPVQPQMMGYPGQPQVMGYPGQPIMGYPQYMPQQFYYQQPTTYIKYGHGHHHCH
ncbi:hypothetical protein DLAC_05679 [Tieghemostelium lacteum]|uniref:WW domain-containing protein n=1 Tax=Tieghemostelium lacteum TaxID=361077 RepID=A0A151ZGG4_TIELA|nr:hypothetical protein DLAC_05679 [Tieghemostelium lacteum]|eukprot:KYQ93068.1 hypothetical protein DLAC_05679 [Tieghemostelium lacteum]